MNVYFVERIHLLFVFLVFSSIYLNGQSTNFKRFNALQDSVNKYLYKSLDLAEKYASTYDSLAANQDSIYYLGKASYLKGSIEVIKGKSEPATRYFQEALKKFEKIKNKKEIGLSYLMLGVASNLRDDLNTTLEYYYKAKEVFAETKDTTNLVKIMYNISTQKNVQGKYDEDIAMKLEVLEMLKYKPSMMMEATIRPNLAHSYYSNGQLDLAQEIIEEYLANPKFQKLLTLRTDALLTYSFILQEKKQINKAIKVAKESLDVAQEKEFSDKILKSHQQLYKLYKLQNNKAKTLAHLESYQELYEKEFSIEREETLKELKVKYETEKKDDQILLLNKDNEINQLKIKQSSQLTWALLFGLVLASILAFLAWRLQKIKSKTNQELAVKNDLITKALNEKNILLREIHHRVKNNLQVISSLLKLQSQYIEDEGAVKAIAEGRNRVHSMALLHQNLYNEDNLTGVNMKEYFTNLIEGLFDAYKITDIKLVTEIEDLTLDIDTVIPLGLISNELVSNALKHAFDNVENGILTVKLWEKDSHLLFNVRDNGNGYDENSVAEGKKSFGQKLIKSLSDKLEADVQVTTTTGTDVTLSIKDYKKVG